MTDHPDLVRNRAQLPESFHRDIERNHVVILAANSSRGLV